jgi:hypothetical protein
MTQITVRVSQDGGDVGGRDNRVLQGAVDYVASLGGGTVEVGPGVYEMRDSLHLRNNVTVRGSGPETILRQAGGTTAKLVLDGDYGEEQITISTEADTSPFAVGSGVAIWDERAGGFHVTVCTLTAGPLDPTVPEERLGRTFSLSAPMYADYLVKRGAVAATTYPVISGYHVAGARVERLAIDGNRAHNAPLGGCRGGGIFLFRSHGAVIQDCVVRDYNGDGISFQTSHDVRVERCEISACAQLGLHPGSGSQRPVIVDCYSHDNGSIGLFLCWRVRGGLFERNRLERNGRTGISIGHKDTDNLFVENVSVGNGRYGVLFRDESAPMAGHRNRFVACTIEGNATDPAAGEGSDVHVDGGTTGVVFERCTIGGAVTVGPHAEAPRLISPVQRKEAVPA